MSNDRSFDPFICMSTSVSLASVDMIESIGALTALRRCEDSTIHQKMEMRDLRSALAKAQAAVENFEACIAAGIETCTREEFEKACMPKRGGPTEKFPDAPYCNPD
jgi:hypothetical protein